MACCVVPTWTFWSTETLGIFSRGFVIIHRAGFNVKRNWRSWWYSWEKKKQSPVLWQPENARELHCSIERCVESTATLATTHGLFQQGSFPPVCLFPFAPLSLSRSKCWTEISIECFSSYRLFIICVWIYLCMCIYFLSLSYKYDWMLTFNMWLVDIRWTDINRFRSINHGGRSQHRARSKQSLEFGLFSIVQPGMNSPLPASR